MIPLGIRGGVRLHVGFNIRLIPQPNGMPAEYAKSSITSYYTSRVLFKGRVNMEEMIFNLKHHWSSVDCQDLELYGIS